MNNNVFEGEVVEKKGKKEDVPKQVIFVLSMVVMVGLLCVLASLTYVFVWLCVQIAGLL